MTQNQKIFIKNQNRWLVVIAAVFMELALGAIYSWSTFAGYLKTGEGWTSTQTQWVFSIATLALAVAVIFAGRLNERFGPEIFQDFLAGSVLYLIVKFYSSNHNINLEMIMLFLIIQHI